MTAFDNITLVQTRVNFLEMHREPCFPVLVKEEVSFRFLEKPICVQRYRDLYYGVGKEYHWLDRMVMPDAELSLAINNPGVNIYVVLINNEEAGFAEFMLQDEFVEILYFGLFETYTGKAYGKFFLQWAITNGWSYGRPRLQLNTCGLDHPKALPNYINAGFTIVKTEMQERKFLLR